MRDPDRVPVREPVREPEAAPEADPEPDRPIPPADCPRAREPGPTADPPTPARETDYAHEPADVPDEAADACPAPSAVDDDWDGRLAAGPPPRLRAPRGNRDPARRDPRVDDDDDDDEGNDNDDAAPTGTDGDVGDAADATGDEILLPDGGRQATAGDGDTDGTDADEETPGPDEHPAEEGRESPADETTPGGEVHRDDSTTVASPMVAVYRHDCHKMRARPHASAADEHAGVPVNETVPHGADADAALLSRPRGDPEQTVANHISPYRLSLRTGEATISSEVLQDGVGPNIERLISPDDPAELHARWLTSDLPATYNESVHYPYTSLKYHTLLVAALLDNYRAGHAFADLWLVATRCDGTAVEPQGESRDSPDPETVRAADGVTPHRTVLWTPPLALHVTGTPGTRPAARLGAHPARSFADVWSRLSAHPIDADGDRRWRLFDAHLRRIRSWSTALQFIEESLVAGAGGPAVDDRPRSGQSATGGETR